MFKKIMSKLGIDTNGMEAFQESVVRSISSLAVEINRLNKELEELKVKSCSCPKPAVDGYLTVTEFMKLHSVVLTPLQARMLGVQCKKLSNQKGISILKGIRNAYSESIIIECLKDIGVTV